MKASTLVGTIATVLWLAGAVIYLKLEWPIVALKPNEIGDYLAGVFSPVAFLWLILGYRQQGEELALNTKALELQVDELRHSVAQQMALAKAATDQHNFEVKLAKEERMREFYAAQPKLTVAYGSWDLQSPQPQGIIQLTNVGVSCFQITVKADAPTRVSGGVQQWHRNHTMDIKVNFEPGHIPTAAVICIEYYDNEGMHQNQQLTLNFTRLPAGTSQRWALTHVGPGFPPEVNQV